MRLNIAVVATVTPCANTNAHSKVKKNIHRFEAEIHTSDTPDSLLLCPEDFYRKYAGKVPEGRHHELEIMDPREDFFDRHKLHIHKARKEGLKPFVCFPKQMPTLSEAMDIFGVWCLGTVVTLERHIDLNTVYTDECGEDPVTFILVMNEKYGIRIAESVKT